LFPPLEYIGQSSTKSSIWKIQIRHHCCWRTVNSRYMLGAYSHYSIFVFHICCDMGLLFMRSHPKDRPIQSPRTSKVYQASTLTLILTGSLLGNWL
jgi:hypothetical protein